MLYLRSWRECWNWQTGQTKDLVAVMSCGFKSHLPHTYSSIAQSVEHAAVNRAVVGSSPTRGVFLSGKSQFVFIWIILRLRGQAVKTSPFHGGNTGSIPVGVTYNIIWRHSQAVRHGSATPLSSVRFRLSPLKSRELQDFLELFVVFININRTKSAIKSKNLQKLTF